MNSPVSLQDLLMFLVFCIAITAGVFFIIMLYHITTVLKKVNRLLDQNNDNIVRTITILPEFVKNSNDVALGIKEGITGIEEVVGETASALGEGVDGVLNFAKIASNIVTVILSLFKGK